MPRVVKPSPKPKTLRWFGECRENWCVPAEPTGSYRYPRSQIDCKCWCPTMPLIRKPTATTRKEPPTAQDALQALKTGTTEQRWAAARMAAEVAGGVEALAAALPVEADARVREAILTSLSRIGSAQSV